MAFHLVNTFLLLGAMTLAAWFAGKDWPLGIHAPPRLVAPSAGALIAVLAVGASGAVTALGDTLVLTAGIAPGESPLVARLVASRFYHPTMAVAAFIFVVGFVLWLRPRVGEPTRRHGRWLLAVFMTELVLGALNVFLKAPIWMQLVHLAAADLLWIFLVLMAAEALTTARGSTPSAML